MPESRESLISLLQTITAISFAAGVVFVLLALIAFRRSRQDAFWRYRRQAGQRGLRYGVLALVSLVTGSAFLLITLTISYVDDRNRTAIVPPNTATPTLAALVVATDTLTATDAPIATPSEIIEPTSTLVPTQEIPPTLTEIAVVPTPAPVTSGALNITAIDDMISDEWRPIQASSSFSTEATRFYFFFSFDDIEQGTAWGQVLLRDGEVIRQRNQQWGVTDSSGEAFFFFGDSRGFAAGNYEVQLTIGDIPVASARFIVLPE